MYYLAEAEMKCKNSIIKNMLTAVNCSRRELNQLENSFLRWETMCKNIKDLQDNFVLSR